MKFCQRLFRGSLFQGRNYIVPIHKGKDITPEYDFICIDDIIKRLNEKKDTTNVLILDACRAEEQNRTFKKSGFATGRDAPAFGKSLSNRFGVPADAEYCIIYSCDPGTTSLGSGSGENSLFTAALLENIAEPGMDIEKVVKETSKTLKSLTDGKQRCWSNSCLSESFFFNP